MRETDRSLVMNMATSPEDAMIIRSTIDPGRNPGPRTVAEGTGTADLARWASGAPAWPTAAPSTAPAA